MTPHYLLLWKIVMTLTKRYQPMMDLVTEILMVASLLVTSKMLVITNHSIRIRVCFNQLRSDTVIFIPATLNTLWIQTAGLNTHCPNHTRTNFMVRVISRYVHHLHTCNYAY